jgi:hypothetical protein
MQIDIKQRPKSKLFKQPHVITLSQMVRVKLVVIKDLEMLLDDGLQPCLVFEATARRDLGDAWNRFFSDYLSYGNNAEAIWRDVMGLHQILASVSR